MRKQLGREQKKGGPDTLTAASTQVLANVSNGADTGDCVTAELAFDRREVVAQQVKNFLGIACGR
jgi:hypothetical protein